MIKTIFEISDGGQDGTDGEIICSVSDPELASRVALNQGPMGRGNGKVKEIYVYEKFDDLPDKIKERILRDEKLQETENVKLLEK